MLAGTLPSNLRSDWLLAEENEEITRLKIPHDRVMIPGVYAHPRLPIVPMSAGLYDTNSLSEPRELEGNNCLIWSPHWGCDV